MSASKDGPWLWGLLDGPLLQSLHLSKKLTKSSENPSSTLLCMNQRESRSRVLLITVERV